MINKKVLNKCDSIKIFEEIVKIPRPSGKEKLLVNFLVDFAKSCNLEYNLCGKNNIIIYKKATNKKCDKTLILQAHLDMVCEKDLNSKINFSKEGIKTFLDGDFIKAKGTTLGADNGIGIALILHILKSKSLKHPNLECVFTSQEETTMLGAKTLNYSLLKGRILLSLDGSFEQKIDTASASMVVVKLSKKFEPINLKNKTLKFTISGLTGGHSGEDINKNRLNAIKFILELIKHKTDVKVLKINGGDKSNAIPHTCSIIAKNGVKVSTINTISQLINQSAKLNNNNQIKFCIKNSNLKFGLNSADENNLIKLLNSLPNGVLKQEKNTVITSCNLAKVETKKDDIQVTLSVRSSNEKFENDAIKNIKNLASQFGFNFKILNKAPGFEENKKSHITKLCLDSYEKLYNKKIEAGPIHAGLEGGVFYENINNLDMCVIGSNIFDMHSTKERASISSIKRVEKWLEKIVEEF